MSFDKTKLSGNIGAGSYAPKQYTYTTADTKATVIASGYFDDMADVFEVGDIITACTDTGTTAAVYALFVDSNDGSTVTTSFVGVA